MKTKRATAIQLTAALLILGLLSSGCNLLDIILGSVAARCAEPTFAVTTTVDRNRGACSASDCSLREAISLSNACPGRQSITIPAGNYILTIAGPSEDNNRTGDLDITDSVSIQGEGNAVVDGNYTDRVFDILPGATVAIQHLAIQNGWAHSGASDPNGGGGGIRNQGTLQLQNSAVNNNSSSDRTAILGYGGGILGLGSTEVISSTISANIADQGAGIAFMPRSGSTPPELQISSSSVTDNAARLGGGIAVDRYPGGPNPTLTISGATSASRNTAVDGGGLHLGGSHEILTANLTQFVIDDNTASDQGAGIWNAGQLTLQQGELGHNTGMGGSSLTGGAIYNENILDATHVQFQNNRADSGAALWNNHTATLTQSSTYEDFTGAYPPSRAALEVTGGTLTLLNVTVLGDGSGLELSGGHADISFSTFNNFTYDLKASAGSSVALDSSLLTGDYDGGCILAEPSILTSLGYNEDKNGNCGLHGPHDGAGNQMFGPTTTEDGTVILPIYNVPALDSANPSTCPAQDQRSVSRPQGAACDRGAYEYSSSIPLPLVYATPEAPTIVATKQGGIIVIPSFTPSAQLQLTLIQNANCRRGPGTVYGVLTSVLKGQTVQLSGRNDDSTWWYTILPGNNRCWISMVAGQPNGDTSQLPVLQAPPTPKPTEEPNTCSQYKDVQACMSAGCTWNPNKQACH